MKIGEFLWYVNYASIKLLSKMYLVLLYFPDGVSWLLEADIYTLSPKALVNTVII